MLPPFSIVIPCFNEQARIGETLGVSKQGAQQRLRVDELDYQKHIALLGPEPEMVFKTMGVMPEHQSSRVGSLFIKFFFSLRRMVSAPSTLMHTSLVPPQESDLMVEMPTFSSRH